MPFYTPKTDWNTAFNDGQEIIKRFNYINENIKFIKREPNTYNGVKTYNGGIKTDSILSDNYNTLSLGGSSYPVYYKGGKAGYLPVSFSVATFNNHHLTNNSLDMFSDSTNVDWKKFRNIDNDTNQTLYATSFYGYSGDNDNYKQIRVLAFGGRVSTGADIDYYLDDVYQFTRSYTGSGLSLGQTRIYYENVGVGEIKMITKPNILGSTGVPNIYIRRARYPFVENEPVKVLNTSYTATENRVITLDDYNNNRLY